MDPRLCLKALSNAIDARDWASAVMSLNAYYRWRVAGGHEPVIDGQRGDTYADAEVTRLADTLEGATEDAT